MKILLSLFFVLLLPVSLADDLDMVQSMERQDQQLIFTCAEGQRIALQVVTDDIIRVRKTQSKAFKKSQMIEFGYVYDKASNLCDTYTRIAEKGEAIFKDIPHDKNPAQCLFEVKCDGYESVTKRIFENTWNQK